MKNIHRITATAITGLVLFGTAACGDAYNREEFITELTDEGITEEQATCITDKVEEGFGLERLNSRGINNELTAEEEEIMTDATFECVLGS